MPNNNHDNQNGNEEPLSDKEIESFMKRLENLQQDFSDMKASLTNEIDEWAKETAGPHLELMLQNQDEALKRLDDPEPRLREVAIHIAINHWRIGDCMASKWEQMAMSDPDIEVRGRAIGALGATYMNSGDARIGCFLATISCNENEHQDIRRSAYVSLLILHNLGGEIQRPHYPGRFPEDVDWAFVQTYLGGWVSSSPKCWPRRS